MRLATLFATTSILLAISPVYAEAPKKPSEKLLVILDAGHGGEDTGALRKFGNKTITEKELTLALAKQTAATLKRYGVDVVLTRNGDTYIGLDKRTEIANAAARNNRNAVFISIHANSSSDTRSNGIETYIFNATNNEAARRLADLENGKRWAQSHGTLELILSDLATTANYGASLQLACLVQESVLDHLKQQGQRQLRNRGVRQALFYVLMQTHMPSMLFEPGFLSNPQELSKMLNPLYQRTVAEALSRGILGWQKNQSSSRHESERLSALQKCQI